VSIGFLGLEIGKRAITAQQTALTITGHNIANANTVGYTRQVAQMETTTPYCTPSLQTAVGVGQIGTGVAVGTIERIREEFLDNQYRNESKAAGYWQSISESISKLEVIINEPSDSGLREVMDQFWEAWQDLVSNPENDSTRTVVAERGATLADTFNHTYRQLVELRDDVNSILETRVQDINSMAEQIKDLNKQILAINVSGQQPNDLLDRRDLLLDQLSKIVDISVHQESNGTIAVQLGGRTLVQGLTYSTLDTEADANGMQMIVWKDTRVKTQISGGELKGLLDVRGATLLPADASSDYRGLVPEMIDKLNRLAMAIVQETNQLHRQGFSLINKTGTPDGANFFAEPADPGTVSDWAQYMKVADDILNDPRGIAAAGQRTWGDPLTGGDPVPPAEAQPINFGDGNNALNLARLKHALTIDGAMTMDDFWRSLASTIGVQGQQAKRMAQNQDNLVGELDNKRQSISGVSLDEEMTNMIRYQHAYNAAARFINAIDEQLDLVVNRLGLVGR
jgi:flagellar hook-associated protein 1 FlgK